MPAEHRRTTPVTPPDHFYDLAQIHLWLDNEEGWHWSFEEYFEALRHFQQGSVHMVWDLDAQHLRSAWEVVRYVKDFYVGPEQLDIKLYELKQSSPLPVEMVRDHTTAFKQMTTSTTSHNKILS